MMHIHCCKKRNCWHTLADSEVHYDPV